MRTLTRPDFPGPSSAFNDPPLRHLAEHPIWTGNPRFAIAGMPTPRAMAWAEDQGKAAIQGKLETKGRP